MISKRAHGLECQAFSNAVFRKMTAAPKTTKVARSGRPKCSKCAVHLRKILLNSCCISFRRARPGLGSSGIDMLNSSRVGHIEDRGITAEPVCSAAIGQVPYWCRGHLLLVTKSPDRDCARQLQCLEDRFTSLTSSLFPAPIDFP